MSIVKKIWWLIVGPNPPPAARLVTELKFHHGDQVLTLWPEKAYEDGWVVGWCPELRNNLAVTPANLVPCDHDGWQTGCTYCEVQEHLATERLP